MARPVPRHLSDNNFTGTLPASIGDATGLSSLWLNGNMFSGELPSSITNLVNVKDLCVALRDLLACCAPATRVPCRAVRGVSPCGRLPCIDVPPLWAWVRRWCCRAINNNHFTGPLPSAIGNMKSLMNLITENTMLSGPLPTSLCMLSDLQTLVLNNCAFSGPLPSCMGKLNVWELHISNNRFTGSLAVVGQMERLQDLYVRLERR